MENILTKNQVMLTGYLTEVGCPKIMVLYIVTRLWNEAAVIEMLEFCADNPNASPQELLEASSKIYSKYRAEIEKAEEENEERYRAEEEEEANEAEDEDAGDICT